MLKDKKLFVFDMDGTIYLGEKVFSEAVKFINELRNKGKKVLFFTNNASHGRAFYIPKLIRMGFNPKEDEILTSGDVTCVFLNRYRQDKEVYLVGTPELNEVFEEYKINLTDGSKADIVVTSFDTTLTYDKLSKACRLIMNGAEYFSTHPDFNCPTEDGFIPDSGAISAFVTASTKVEPRYFGKPYKDTIDMICEATGCNLSDAVVFGDRLYTDIALGKRNGVSSVLVLTGETKIDDVNNALEKDKPDYIFNNLEEVRKIIFED